MRGYVRVGGLGNSDLLSLQISVNHWTICDLGLNWVFLFG